jgi:hypothetical protein
MHENSLRWLSARALRSPVAARRLPIFPQGRAQSTARKQASLGRCIELLLKYSPPCNATLLRLLGGLRKGVKQQGVRALQPQCAESGKKYCNRCKAVAYCSNECQKKAHKKVCKAPRGDE